jgi:hypothetical protein
MMNWKLIFKAGLLILLSGVSIGFVESGFTPGSKEMMLTKYIGALGAHFLLYAAVFAWLGYRQLHRPFVHAIAAWLVSFIIATAIMAAFRSFFSLPKSEAQPLLLIAVDWVVTAMALGIGLLVGRHLANSRNAALSRHEA